MQSETNYIKSRHKIHVCTNINNVQKLPTCESNSVLREETEVNMKNKISDKTNYYYIVDVQKHNT